MYSCWLTANSCGGSPPVHYAAPSHFAARRERRTKTTTMSAGTTASDGIPRAAASRIVVTTTAVTPTAAATPTTTGLPFIDNCSIGRAPLLVKRRRAHADKRRNGWPRLSNRIMTTAKRIASSTPMLRTLHFFSGSYGRRRRGIPVALRLKIAHRIDSKE